MGAMLVIVLLAWMCSGCTFLAWESQRYKPRYKPGAEYDGPPKVTLRAYPGVLLKPAPVTFQLLVLGDMTGCTWIAWDVAGADASGSSACERSAARTYYVKCWGSCVTRVRVLGADGRQLAAGSVTVNVGGGD